MARHKEAGPPATALHTAAEPPVECHPLHQGPEHLEDELLVTTPPAITEVGLLVRELPDNMLIMRGESAKTGVMSNLLDLLKFHIHDVIFSTSHA